MVKSYMSEFVNTILPTYLTIQWIESIHSGITNAEHSQILHYGLVNNNDPVQTAKDLMIETTFKSKIAQLINDARFYTSLES